MNWNVIRENKIKFYVRSILPDTNLTLNKIYLVDTYLYMDDDHWYNVKNDLGISEYYSMKFFKILSDKEVRKEKINKILNAN